MTNGFEIMAAYAFMALFPIVNPVGTAPIFLAMIPGATHAEQRHLSVGSPFILDSEVRPHIPREKRSWNPLFGVRWATPEPTSAKLENHTPTSC